MKIVVKVICSNLLFEPVYLGYNYSLLIMRKCRSNINDFISIYKRN
jgi:hypothetical protein